MTEARDRILRRLGEGSDGKTLGHFLPKVPVATEGSAALERPLRLSSAWATTFSANLELAKQGNAALAQAETFASVYVSRPTGQATA